MSEKPTGFTFGSNTSNVFASKPAEENSTSKPTGFSFGAQTGTTSGGFSLGAAQAKPGPFSFGGNSTATGSSEVKKTTAPAGQSTFSFGSVASTGTAPTEMKNASLPTQSSFSFGSATSKESTTGTTGTASNPPKFSFGAPSSTSADQKTTYGSTSASGNEKPATGLFGAGLSLNSNSSAPKEVSSVPKFGFSANTSAETKPGNNRNAPSTSGTSTSSVFGKPSTDEFAFGSGKATIPATPAPANNNPALNFGTPSNNVTQSPLTLSALETPANDKQKTQKDANNEKSSGFSMPSFSTKQEEKKTEPNSAQKSELNNNQSIISSNVEKSQTKIDVSGYLKGKALGEIFSEWQNSLNESVTLFHKNAAEISEIDTEILDNSEKIYNFSTEISKIESQQEAIFGTLNYIESQQDQIENELNMFEDKIKGIYANQGNMNSNLSKISKMAASAQEEREKTFQLAESLTNDVFKIKNQVMEMVSFANEMWKPREPNCNDTSLLMINKLLNEQFEQLRWIDHNSDLLKQKFADIKEYRRFMETEIETSGMNSGRKSFK